MAAAVPDRRRQILDAAHAVFLQKGYAGAGIADIRARSGASTGSIYHFFDGKASIAAALFLEAVDGWAVATEAARTGDSAEAEIRSSVEGLIDWGLARPDQFRILDEMRFVEPLIRESPEMSRLLDAGEAAARDTYETRAQRGAVRALPWPIARGLILGPAYDYLRAAAAGRADVPPRAARRLLSDAAWSAVRA
jgi:AcrR family transcriptional regulator